VLSDNDQNKVVTKQGVYRIIELTGTQTPGEIIIHRWGAKTMSLISREQIEQGTMTGYVVCAEFGVWYLARLVEFFNPEKLPRLYLCESTVIRGTTSQELQQNLVLLTADIESQWAEIDADNYPVVTVPDPVEEFIEEPKYPGPLLTETVEFQTEKPFNLEQKYQVPPSSAGEGGDDENES